MLAVPADEAPAARVINQRDDRHDLSVNHAWNVAANTPLFATNRGKIGGMAVFEGASYGLLFDVRITSALAPSLDS